MSDNAVLSDLVSPMDDVLLCLNLLQVFNVRLYNDYARILVADWCHEAATSIYGHMRTTTNKTNGYK